MAAQLVEAEHRIEGTSSKRSDLTLEVGMESAHHPPKWKILLAFGIIYFVWGATFFAIRVGVHEVPPLLFCAMRFVAAGLIVFIWAIAHKERPPSRRQWISAFLLAFLIFVVDYAFLFWAEQRIP